MVYHNVVENISSNAPPPKNDANDNRKNYDANFGDCGDPSGMLGPLLEVADQMMGAFDGFDKLVSQGIKGAQELGGKLVDALEEVGPAALAI